VLWPVVLKAGGSLWSGFNEENRGSGVQERAGSMAPRIGGGFPHIMQALYRQMFIAMNVFVAICPIMGILSANC
jgi:hypothetical protein